jgi:acyl-ACP thioesterase
MWQEEHRVRFGDIDPSDRLTLAAAFNLFQEAAMSHAEDLGVGRESLAQTGELWILSRISVYIARRPRFREDIIVRSWPRGWEKLFAIRDYDILDREGRAVVRGRSGWIILDMAKRRPLRVQQVVEPLPSNEGINAFSALSPGLAGRVTLQKRGERIAAYSDIDYNGHVNNARYIHWLQDITPLETLEQADQMRLDINYLSEVMPGETVELWSGPLEAGDFYLPGSPREDYPERIKEALAYEGRRPGSDKPVLRAELRTSRLLGGC